MSGDADNFLPVTRTVTSAVDLLLKLTAIVGVFVATGWLLRADVTHVVRLERLAVPAEAAAEYSVVSGEPMAAPVLNVLNELTPGDLEPPALVLASATETFSIDDGIAPPEILELDAAICPANDADMIARVFGMESCSYSGIPAYVGQLTPLVTGPDLQAVILAVENTAEREVVLTATNLGRRTAAVSVQYPAGFPLAPDVDIPATLGVGQRDEIRWTAPDNQVVNLADFSMVWRQDPNGLLDATEGTVYALGIAVLLIWVVPLGIDGFKRLSRRKAAAQANSEAAVGGGVER